MATSTRPRKPRAASSVSDKPAGITLNLDALEIEQPDTPFVALLGGRRLTFKNPQEVPWQDLYALDDPEKFAETCLAEDDQDYFLETPLETGKMGRLMQAYRAHYGLGDPGNSGA